MATQDEAGTAQPGPAPHPEQADAQTNHPLLVVGVGASAGGLEAFKELLGHLPDDPGMAFLYAQHLDPNAKSMLPEILASVSRLPIQEVAEGMQVQANHVYLLPPGMSMALVDGALTVAPRPTTRGTSMVIDHLFRSLADVRKGLAVGVILSGTGTDGTLGFQAIKAAGGITFAQDTSAKFDSMPRSAIRDGSVDYVLSPADVARKLLALARHPYAAEVAFAGHVLAEDGDVNKIMTLLRASTDVDFTQYKRTTITRRIRRRMALLGLDDFGSYLHRLETDAAEIQNLYQDFLIRVTRFFRDEEVFEALKNTVFPNLVKDRSPNAPIRVWVAGCSTGEEVYSLAICLLEYLGDHETNFPIKILATDLNEAALEKARAGIYPDNIELDVSPERLRRFFAKVDGNYQISKFIRDLCVFSRHNVTNDPPFSRLDLVSCRNLLIYLEAALQRRVLPILHYALNPGGYLLLGASETIGAYTDLFEVVDQKHRIYWRTYVSHSTPDVHFGDYVGPTGGSVRRAAAPSGTLLYRALDVQKEADRVVLAKFAPVGVVIDENMTVLQFRGRTGPYLEPAPGLASLDLLKMLREGLLSEVRAAISQAKAENAAARREGVILKEGDAFRQVGIEVLPIKVPPAGARCFLVLFKGEPQPPPARPDEPHRDAEEAAAARVSTDQQVVQLQQELTSTREYLQSIIEEYESTCEELKSASEEILSSNEELQSTNEELQTAKEETQSTNEELATLNEELHHRNVQLTQVNNDLLNLLGAVNVPIVLVSRDLRIRRFTPMAEKVLNLIPSDLGRPIGDIKPNVNVADLSELIARVIDSLTPLEMEIQDRAGHSYLLRIRPYVTLDNKIDGASILLLDLDLFKRGAEGPKPAPAP